MSAHGTLGEVPAATLRDDLIATLRDKSRDDPYFDPVRVADAVLPVFDSWLGAVLADEATVEAVAGLIYKGETSPGQIVHHLHVQATRHARTALAALASLLVKEASDGS